MNVFLKKTVEYRKKTLTLYATNRYLTYLFLKIMTKQIPINIKSLATKLLVVFIMCLPFWSSKSYSQEAESYVVLNTTDGTLTFKHDTEKPSDAYSLNYGYNFPSWKNQAEKIKTVIFDDSFADARPEFCSYWFANCENLTSIIGIENLNTENVKLMMCMFYHCKSLTSLDVSKFDTKNVEDMNGMFDTCSGLTTLDVSNFNTSNVTEMEAMFADCTGLKSIDISNFDTRNVTKMSSLFKNCSSLTSLDISKLNTDKVESMKWMFRGCSNLTSINVSTLNTGNAKSMYGMFRNCSSLTSLDLSNFDTKNVTDMTDMFNRCSSLTSLDLSNFDTKNVTEMSGMFTYCSALPSLDISSFNTSNVTSMSWMFYGCSALESLDLSRFNTEKVTNMNRMFAFDENLTTIYVSDKFVTTALTNNEDIFINCQNLKGAIEYENGKDGKEFANYTTGYFTKSTFSGIKSHDANDFHKTNYYDLQGHRLGKLKRGLNIIKRGNKTVKVSVK